MHRLDPDERVAIDADDMDWLKHTHSGVPAGATLPRAPLAGAGAVVSDNHAAAALARNYPGGGAGLPRRGAGTKSRRSS